MKFEAIKRKVVAGRGHIFLVKLPDTGKPTDLLGRRLNIDGKYYKCTGIESRGPARAGDEACLVTAPIK